MKKYLKLIAFVLIAVLMFTSCGKKKPKGIELPPDESSLRTGNAQSTVSGNGYKTISGDDENNNSILGGNNNSISGESNNSILGGKNISFDDEYGKGENGVSEMVVPITDDSYTPPKSGKVRKPKATSDAPENTPLPDGNTFDNAAPTESSGAEQNP